MGTAESGELKVSRWVVDGLESGVARLEAPDGKVFTVPAEWLPAKAREGDSLRIAGVALTAESCMAATVDSSSRQAHDAGRQAELERLRNAEPEEDLDL